jgi:head-tail adaptor
MSVAAMIARFAKEVGIRRPAYTKNAIGAATKTYSASTATAFIQERSAFESVSQGREQMRSSAVLYFAGSVDVRTDDIIVLPATGSDCAQYRVTGVRIPDQASWHPHCHTIVDCDRLRPNEVVS